MMYGLHIGQGYYQVCDQFSLAFAVSKFELVIKENKDDANLFILISTPEVNRISLGGR
jgi:hypothetical protein